MPQLSWIVAASALTALFVAPPAVVDATMPAVAPTPEPIMPVASPTPEPIMPVSAPTSDGGGGEEEEPVYLGCFHDSKEDRVLGDKMRSSSMSTAACQDYCTEMGAAFMATQYGRECWCSPDGGLDYNRHNEAVGEDALCDYPCSGDDNEICGGFDSFDLYELSATCSGTPVEAYEQCGGSDWTGSTCCSDGYECVEMGQTSGCYSQCRPGSVDESTPAPSSAGESTPVPTTEQAAPTREPVTPTAPEPTPGPVDSPTPEPATPTPPGSPGTPSDMVEMLELHNEARCIHGAKPLTWSVDVEASAREHAQRLTDTCGGLYHSSSNERYGYGENLYACWGSDTCYSDAAAMQGLYNDEIRATSVTAYGGHATQILWKATEKLGCIVATCSSSGTPYTFLVCQYDPPGNYGGEYEEQVGLPTNEGNC